MVQNGTVLEEVRLLRFNYFCTYMYQNSKYIILSIICNEL